MSPRREMGRGSWGRVVFGRQPKASPMRGSGCLSALALIVPAALLVASAMTLVQAVTS